jgi:hypothetical protein
MPRRRTPATESTLNHTGKVATSLFKWAATDHYGIAQSLSSMPKMSFPQEMKFILIGTVYSVIGAILSALWIWGRRSGCARRSTPWRKALIPCS